ncbi:hypothetical protein LJR245_007579 [Rhizobium leguminosarum]|uniref:hypothetical protein n=1 Tax=Rhizobium leguminosarum TaxID=384 RepID=UPI003ECEACEC
MIEEDDPNLVTSGKSGKIIVDGYPFSIDIFRLESDTKWTLEIVDYLGTSYVWEDEFPSADVARKSAIMVIEAEGAMAFMRQNNVIPFRER